MANKEKYKMANKEAKKEITLAKNKAYEKLCQRLETKERERRMRYRGSTCASYAMDFTESSSVKNQASLPLLSKTMRGKRRRGR